MTSGSRSTAREAPFGKTTHSGTDSLRFVEARKLAPGKYISSGGPRISEDAGMGPSHGGQRTQLFAPTRHWRSSLAPRD